MENDKKVLCKEDFGSFHANRWYDANLSLDGKSIFVILNVRDTYNFGRWFNINGFNSFSESFSDHFYTLKEVRKFKIREINGKSI